MHSYKHEHKGIMDLGWEGLGEALKELAATIAHVNTRIMDADRNRPPELQNDPAEEEKIRMRPEYQAGEQFLRQELQRGMAPQQVAECVFNAIREAKFYIITHPDWKPAVQLWMEDILQERNPTNPSAYLLQE